MLPIRRSLSGVGASRWVLVLWTAVLYFWGVQWAGVMNARVPPGSVISFTILMTVHLGLYVAGTQAPSLPRRSQIAYLAAQALLVVLASLVSSGLLVALGLYVALLAEMVALLSDTRLAPLAGAACLFLFTVNLTLLSGSGTVPVFLAHRPVPVPVILAIVIPVFLVVVLCVLLFAHQRRVHARTVRLLEELEQAHRQLAESAAQVEALTLAAERRRIARELHDTLAQGVAGLILQLEAAKSHLVDGRGERALQIVTQTMRGARSALAAARSAIEDLRTDAALSADDGQALEDEVDRFTTATGIPCSVDVCSLAALQDGVGESVLRFVSEGLTNVARHARARHAWVCVTRRDHQLIVEVRDDGDGFDPGEPALRGHYGLVGLRERARLLGGRFSLTSAPGQGTALRLLLPAEGRAT
jgi:NarL family two-component system sensor histidine kinase YdfH